MPDEGEAQTHFPIMDAVVVIRWDAELGAVVVSTGDLDPFSAYGMVTLAGDRLRGAMATVVLEDDDGGGDEEEEYEDG